MKNPNAISILDGLTDFASSNVAEGLAAVGKGIGAVMLMIVLFYYLVSILDGGRFQLKMAVPLIVFLFVCNFGWISRPVISFTRTMTQGFVEPLDNAKRAIAYAHTGDSLATLTCIGTWDSERLEEERLGRRAARERIQMLEQAARFDGIHGYRTEITADSINSLKAALTESADGEADANMPVAGSNDDTQGSVHRGIIRSTNRFADNINAETQAGVRGPMAHTISGVIAAIIQFICTIMSFVMRAFGGVMSAIIVAFGPVTFAFAIMPGQAGTIKSWFLRLCQFALYAPLCSLVDCFSYKLYDILQATTGTAVTMMVIVVAVCNLVALTSIPSIASMIIEGASGAASLSGGLHALSSSLVGGLTAGKTMAGAGPGLVFGGESVSKVTGAVKNAATGAGAMGLMGMGRSTFGQGGSVKGLFKEMVEKGAELNKKK